ncbi:hypothetical protein B0H17DRAFT_1326808 [Mycena rosella]|uniref:CCHC-type domain-containing protein n=1 Tax=Mycena rosella TaxID=1033263 RepID=A0AAD7GRJ1_MYCRO|nr:hypothetical protein B0H17DRAFT_1326808 [Mycena rosella]
MFTLRALRLRLLAALRAPARPLNGPRSPPPDLVSLDVLDVNAQCRQQGHIAGRCPNIVKCHLCGEEGHISKQCTTAEQTKRT